MKSDESEFKSENYTGNKNNYKNYDDNVHEIIKNKISIQSLKER